LVIEVMQGAWFSVLGNFAIGAAGALVGGSILPPGTAIHLGVASIVPFVNAAIGALILLLPLWLSGSSARDAEGGKLDNEDEEEMQADVDIELAPSRGEADAPPLGSGGGLAFHY
jgi:uncharacterized membrane protein YeaQ/YmgE (transglycosylase-associated protein family)